jgi:hypothetical protein
MLNNCFSLMGVGRIGDFSAQKHGKIEESQREWALLVTFVSQHILKFLNKQNYVVRFT